jgi:uncharacterized protein (DUF39 family)
MRTVESINQKIRQGQVVVHTAETFKALAVEQGIGAAA